MDLEKLKQWMEMAQKYQNGNFWDTIFDQFTDTAEQILKDIQWDHRQADLRPDSL